MTLNDKDKVIDKWRTENSADFGYFDTVENMLEIFLGRGGDFRKRFDTLDLTSVVEIACGKGRHAAQIVERFGNLVLVDTSRDAIDFARKRLHDKQNVRCHHSEDGESLAFIPTGSASSAFSYDAMVHFEPATIYA